MPAAMPKRARTFLALVLLLHGVAALAFAQGAREEKDQFEFAQRLHDEGDYAIAAQELNEFISHFPTSDRLPEAVLRLGEAYLRGGLYQEAIEACQAFIDKYPSHFNVATVMRRKAQALASLDEYTKAGEAFQEVHDAFIGGEYAPQDLLDAGYNYHLGGDLDASASAFRTLLSKYPSSHLVHEATYNLGLVLLEAARPEEALAQFWSLVDYAGPTERKPDALLQIGRIALTHEYEQEADRAFTKLRTDFPKSPAAETSYLVMAQWLSQRGDWEQAARTYEMARQAIPRNDRREQAVLGLAEAYRKLGQSKEALGLYAQFLSVYPASPLLPQARLGLGRAYADLGDDQNALPAFKRLLDGMPDTTVAVAAYSEMGDIWREQGATRKALNAFQRCLTYASDPTTAASTRLRIAQLYETDLKWYDRAAQAYGDLLEGPAEYAAEAQFGLARTFEHTGQHHLAVREYRSYIRGFPGGPRAAESQARIRYLEHFAPLPGANRLGDLVALLAGFPAIGSDPEAQLQLGIFLYQNRDFENATNRFETALEVEPPSACAPEALFRLGESALKLSLKARLEGRADASAQWHQRGMAAHRRLLADHPDSEWSDNAALALIEGEVGKLAPDSLRAERMLEACADFQRTYPESDRLDRASLSMADAHLILGSHHSSHLQSALRSYRVIAETFPDSPVSEEAAYGIGICLARQRQHIDAEETLRGFLFRFPRSSLVDRAQFELGRLLLDREFYQTAAEELSEVLTATSSLELERSSRMLLGECYFRLKDYPRSIQIDDALLERGPDPAVLRRLARAYQEGGRHEEAIRTYATFLRTFPEAADADSIAITRAELLSFLSRNSEAIYALQDFQRKYAKSPLLREAHRVLGDLQFNTGNYAKALKAYGGIPLAAKAEPVFGREILGLYRLKRIKEADKKIKAFRKAHRNAEDWLARFDVEKGRFYLDSGDRKKARGIFEGVIKNHPGTEAAGEAAYHRIRALKKEGEAEEYLKALTAFVKQQRESVYWPQANIELADYRYADEDYGLAAKAYQNAMAGGLSPEEQPSTLSKLVEVHRRLKLYPTAIGYARTLVRDFPRHSLAASARIDIGMMLSRSHAYRQAIEELIPLLTVIEKDEWSSVQNEVAECYFRMQDYESAKREYLNLQYNFQGSTNWLATALFGLARCYEAQGNTTQAILELEKIQSRLGASHVFGIKAGEEIGRLRGLQTPRPTWPSDR